MNIQSSTAEAQGGQNSPPHVLLVAPSHPPTFVPRAAWLQYIGFLAM